MSRSHGWFALRIVIYAAVAVVSDQTASSAQERAAELHEGVSVPVTSAMLHVPTRVVARAAIEEAIRENAWDRAAVLLVEESDRRPPDAEMLLLVARVFFLDHKPLNAAIALKKADALRALHPDERLLLALSYISMHQGEWARPELEQLSANDPTNVTYTYWLGRLDYDRGLFESALAHFRAVVTRERANIRAWDNMALCYEALNQVDEAAAAYETSVGANRESIAPSPWPPLNFGALLRMQGELARAEELLREAVRYGKESARAHYELGAVLEQKGDLPGAIASLQRATAADETYAAPHYALARIYRRQGERTAADAALAKFERLKQPRTMAQP